MVTKRKWSDLSKRSRVLVVALGVVEVSLLAAALIDIRRRPADQIRGSKRMWRGLAFINIVGPLAYFTLGRRQRGAGV
jgi:hypothetical protein